jgi:hypothetical protein
MLWTYPCSVNDQCLREGAVMCFASNRGIVEVQKGIAAYDSLCKQALDTKLYYLGTADQLERDFFIKLYRPDDGRVLAVQRGNEGLLLELKIERFQYPLSIVLPRRKDAVQYALVPVMVSLYGCLTGIGHVAEQPLQQIRNCVGSRYPWITLKPIQAPGALPDNSPSIMHKRR